MRYGFIQIPRAVIDARIGLPRLGTEYAIALLDLIAMASIRKHSVLIRGKKVALDKGEAVVSRRKLAERWGWSVRAVSEFIAKCQESEGWTERAENGVSILKIVFKEAEHQNVKKCNTKIEESGTAKTEKAEHLKPLRKAINKGIAKGDSKKAEHLNRKKCNTKNGKNGTLKGKKAEHLAKCSNINNNIKDIYNIKDNKYIYVYNARTREESLLIRLVRIFKPKALLPRPEKEQTLWNAVKDNLQEEQIKLLEWFYALESSKKYTLLWNRKKTVEGLLNNLQSQIEYAQEYKEDLSLNSSTGDKPCKKNRELSERSGEQKKENPSAFESLTSTLLGY